MLQGHDAQSCSQQDTPFPLQFEYTSASRLHATVAFKRNKQPSMNMINIKQFIITLHA